MCDATFTLGQRGSHFFQCPTRRDHTRLPRKLQSILSSKHIASVHHVTLGFEDSFLITYRDTSGNDNIESHDLPEELEDFLYAKSAEGQPLRNIPRLNLTLGPHNDSFFVNDGSAYLWMNLPPLLLEAVQARIKSGSWIDKPRFVALGADSNFLLITQNNAAVWDLPHYQALEKMIEYSRKQDRGIEEIQNVVLHAYRYEGYIAQSRNGTLISGNLPPWSAAGMEGMKGPVMKSSWDNEVRRRQRDLATRPTLRNLTEKYPSSLRPAALLRREFGNGSQQYFQAQAKGIKLSLSLKVF